MTSLAYLNYNQMQIKISTYVVFSGCQGEYQMTLNNIHILKAFRVILFHWIAGIHQYCIYSYAVE